MEFEKIANIIKRAKELGGDRKTIEFIEDALARLFRDDPDFNEFKFRRAAFASNS